MGQTKKGVWFTIEKEKKDIEWNSIRESVVRIHLYFIYAIRNTYLQILRIIYE